MLETVQGEGGVVPLDKEYVQAVAKACKEKDILLIVDEVQTGMGQNRLPVQLSAVRHPA